MADAKNGNGKIGIATIAIVASMITVSGMLFAGQMAMRERIASLEVRVIQNSELLREMRIDLKSHSVLE